MSSPIDSIKALTCQTRGADRFSFLVGALIADYLAALIAEEIVNAYTPVAISGNQATAKACQAALTRLSVRTMVLTDEEIEKGFLAGLGTILKQAISTRSVGAAAILD